MQMLLFLETLLPRLFSSAITLLVMAILIFFLVESLPGDVCLIMLGQDVQASTLEACQVEFGLDQPALYRLGQWFHGLLNGDAGMSLSRHRNVFEVLIPRLENSLLLAWLAGCIGFPAAILAGLFTGWFDHKGINHWISVTGLCLMALPEFVLALPLIWLFCHSLGWLPAISVMYEGQDWGERLWMTLLPAITLALIMNAHIMQCIRSSARVIRQSPFIQMARMKGVPETRVLWKHGIKSVLAPCTGTLTLYMAWLLSAVVVTEKVFNYPGLGSLLVSSIQDRDYPVVQLCALIMTLLSISCSLFGDCLAFWLNPESRRQKG